MYAAEVPEHDEPDSVRLVEEYLSAAEAILWEVFGFTDTDLDLMAALDELEVRYHAIPVSERRYAALSENYRFVRQVTVAFLLKEEGGR